MGFIFFKDYAYYIVLFLICQASILTTCNISQYHCVILRIIVDCKTD